MKFKLLLRNVFVLLSFANFSLSLKGEDIPHDPYPDNGVFQCETHCCSEVSNATKPGKRKKGHAAYFKPENPKDFIFKGGAHFYVFRLAACITAGYFNDPLYFNKSMDKVNKYWDDLELYLNAVYGRDCGILFDIIRKPELVLSEDPDFKTVYRPDVLDKLIGNEHYDLGILLMPAFGRLHGLAALGGVFSHRNKGDAKATLSFSTIAHEIGHLLGAGHTHENSDGRSTEQGNGNSIMSYGEPRTFFSLASIKDIRSSLISLGYYTDSTRIRFIPGTSESTNMPYIKPFKEEKPLLNREAIRDEYVVTQGTRYQFYIPVKNKNTENFLYHAHPYDPVLTGMRSNMLQRLYPPTKENVIMYHPRYLKARKQGGEMIEQLINYSDQYKVGTYIYMLSAFNQGHHDVAKTLLRIVEGEPFTITQAYVKVDNWDNATAGKSQIRLSWNPCRKLYGPDSKVRILLSTDFGNTFKYVLADEYPNKGSWSGVCPYVPIDTGEYPEVGKVRGGLIKIEVIGEAAYALSKEIPYWLSGETMLLAGGFRIKTDNTISFSPAPKVYEEVETENDLPEQIKLTASYGGKTQEVTGSQEKTGNTVYRRWEASIGNQKAVYTQVIKIKQVSDWDATSHKKALKLSKALYDLYLNIGKLGYPQAGIEPAIRLRKLFGKVFTETGALKSTFESQDLDALERTLIDLGKIGENEVVMPVAGRKYKIASYQHIYGVETRFFLKPNGGKSEILVKDQPDAGANWTCEIVDGLYRFTADNTQLYLEATGKDMNGLKVLRGYTWGAFTFASGGLYPRIAQVNSEGTVISFRESLHPVPTKDDKGNNRGLIVATDFQLIPVEESFDVFYEASGSNQAIYAYLPEKKGVEPFGAFPGIRMTAVGNNRYKVSIPEGYGNEKIIFSYDGSVQKDTAQLTGREATYGTSGKRIHRISLPLAGVATLYLDYPVVIPQNMLAYTATASRAQNNQYELKLTRLSGTLIPAYTAVILKGERAGSYDFVESKQIPLPVEDNRLQGAIEEIPTALLDNDYLYFPLSTAPTLTPEQSKITYPLLNNGANLAARNAYFRLYKYDNNFKVKSVFLNISEFGKFNGDGSSENPYTIADVKRIGTASTDVWVKGRILGGWQANGGVLETINNVMALGIDDKSVIPVFLPATARKGVANMIGHNVYVQGELAPYEGSTGIPENRLKAVDYRDTLTVNSLGYATYYSPYPMELPEGLKAAVVTGVTANTLDLDWHTYASASAVIPAETAVLLKGEAGAYPIKTSLLTPVSATKNLLKGYLLDYIGLSDPAYNYYKLSWGEKGLAFYLHTEAGPLYTSARNAYLLIPAAGITPSEFLIEKGNLSNISEVHAPFNPDAKVYDLYGRCVGLMRDFEQLPKGIYIVNGRKFAK